MENGRNTQWDWAKYLMWAGLDENAVQKMLDRYVEGEI